MRAMRRTVTWMASAALVVLVGGCATTTAPVRDPEPPAGKVTVNLLNAREERLSAQLAALDPALMALSGRASVIAWSCWHTPDTVEEACSAVSSLPRASSVTDVEVHDEVLECQRACTIYRGKFAEARAADLANPQPHRREEECIFHCYDRMALLCGMASDRCAMGCEGRSPTGP